MLCRACQEPKPRVSDRTNRDRSRDLPIPDELCSRCGRLVGPEDTVKRVRAKHSQLERFGLAGKRGGALLERKRKHNH